MAGLSALGIHADGSIKGCPTLPSEYIGGNIREKSLSDILESRQLLFNAGAGTPEGTAHLWGFCGECPNAKSCRGGCTQTATVTLGKSGNNPYCHFRARELGKRGLRERMVPRLLALGKSFDHGSFRLIEEPLDAPWPAGDDKHYTYDRVSWPAGWDAWPEHQRVTIARASAPDRERADHDIVDVQAEWRLVGEHEGRTDARRVEATGGQRVETRCRPDLVSIEIDPHGARCIGDVGVELEADPAIAGTATPLVTVALPVPAYPRISSCR